MRKYLYFLLKTSNVLIIAAFIATILPYFTGHMLSGLYEKYNDKTVFQASGYNRILSELIEENAVIFKDVIDDEGSTTEIVFDPVQSEDSNFYWTSYLADDIDNFNTNGHYHVFDVVEREGVKTLNVNKFAHNINLDPLIWLGRLFFRPPTLNNVVLWNESRIFKLYPPKAEDIYNNGQWIPNAAIPNTLDIVDLANSNQSSQSEYIDELHARRYSFRIGDIEFLNTYYYGCINSICKFTRPLPTTNNKWNIYLNGDTLFSRVSSLSKTWRLDPHDHIEISHESRTGIDKRYYLNVDYINTQDEAHGALWNVFSYPAVTGVNESRAIVDSTDKFMTEVVNAIDRLARTFPEQADKIKEQDVYLTIDRGLQAKMDKHCRDIANNLTRSEGLVSITLLDIRTGDVLAIGQSVPHGYSGQNINLVNHHLGSAFKPFLTMAAMWNWPQIVDMKLRLNTSGFSAADKFIPPSERDPEHPDSVDIFNIRIPTLHEPSSFGKYQVININDFFRYSVNYYAISIGLLGIVDPPERNDTEDYFRGRLLRRDLNFFENQIENNSLLNSLQPFIFRSASGEALDLANTRLAQNLRWLFDIDPSWSSFGQMDPKPWLNLPFLEKGLEGKPLDDLRDAFASICPNKVSLGLDLIRNDHDLRQGYISWLLGSHDNKWNNIKICEAASRMVTQREVIANFIWDKDQLNSDKFADSLYLKLANEIDQVAALREEFKGKYPILLEALKCPCTPNGTAANVGNKFNRLISANVLPRGAQLYGKTGTADPYKRRRLKNGRMAKFDQGVFWGVISIGSENGDNGIAFSVWVSDVANSSRDLTSYAKDLTISAMSDIAKSINTDGIIR